PGHRESVFNSEYERLIKDPPEDLHVNATNYAQYQTFTNKLGPRAAAWQNAINRTPLAKFIIPFYRTPLNILRDAARYTPFELGRAIQADFRNQLIKGGADADIALTKMAMGTAAMTGVAYLAWNSKIRGGGINGADTRELDGVKPYSVQMPDGQ